MATGTLGRRAERRDAGVAAQVLVLVSRSAAPIEEFEQDLTAISKLGRELAGARGRRGHPMKLGPPVASWWTRRNGSWAWQLTQPLPSHVTARDVHEAVAATRNPHAARVQLQASRAEEARPGRDRQPATIRELRVGATAQHRGLR
jgi:hypothetical protein